MSSMIRRIKNFLTNKKTILEWSRNMNISPENKKAYCLGVNKEGIKCGKALECSRYLPSSIDTEVYVNFPIDYDIKNCEIFSKINDK